MCSSAQGVAHETDFPRVRACWRQWLNCVHMGGKVVQDHPRLDAHLRADSHWSEARWNISSLNPHMTCGCTSGGDASSGEFVVLLISVKHMTPEPWELETWGWVEPADAMPQLGYKCPTTSERIAIWDDGVLR